MTIYIWNGRKWLKKAFKTDLMALQYINKHNITEYEDYFGYRYIKIGG